MRGAAGPESLDSVLLEAACLAQIMFGWMANTLQFEKAEPPRLSKDDCSNIYWAISTLSHLVDEANRIHREGSR